MNKTIKEIDKRVDKLKLNNSKNKDHLILTDREYKTLKNSLTEIEEAEILTYRGLFIRIKDSKNKSKKTVKIKV